MFTRNIRMSLFSVGKTYIIHGGNRFLKRKIHIFDIYNNIGLYCLTRKLQSKPINKLKLKL